MRHSLSLLFSLVLISTAAAQPRESYHTTLFGALNPDTKDVVRYSAITGYAAPDGREYALLGGYDGTHIVDITDSPLKEVAFIPGPQSAWREMKTFGAYGYVVSEGGAGLQIIDLSKLPARATLVRSDTSVFRTGHTITQEGNYLYVNGTNPSAGANGGTIIFNVAINPGYPQLVERWRERYVHDATIRNDTMYAAAITEGRLDIVYLGKERKDPKLVTEITYPGAGTHNADLSVDGRYILTTDEVGATAKTLKVWDRSDIGSIEQVADWTPVPGEIIHNVHVRGRLAVVSWYTAGTRIVDITNPADPIQVGYYDTFPGASADFAGNWGVYPYLPSGKIIASDMQTGLYVFTFDGVGAGRVSGIVKDEVTGLPIPGAHVEFPELGRSVEADSLGRYSFAGAVDTLDYIVSAQDYVARGGRAVVSTEGETLNLFLSSLPMVDVAISVVDSSTGRPLNAFSYRMLGRAAGSGRDKASPSIFLLPKDSVVEVIVGAWGFLPKTIRLRPDRSGTEIVELLPGYRDDAELDLGWSLRDKDDDAHSGSWERGPARGTFITSENLRIAIQADSDATPGTGNHAFFTGLSGSSEEVGANDVDEGRATLTSPAFDLTSYTDPYVGISLWYTRNGNQAAVDDTLLLLLSNDDGESWTTFRRITESGTAWRPVEIRVGDRLTPTPLMRVRVVASDLGAPSLVEAAVDDFTVVDRPSGAGVDGRGDMERGARGTVLPNPLSGAGSLRIELESAERQGRLVLYDILGNAAVILYEGAVPAGISEYPLDLSGLPSGRYTWRLEGSDATASGEVVVRR